MISIMRVTLKTKKVVVVDNDQYVVSLLKFLFEREGYEFISFASAGPFFEHIEENPPADLLLTEIVVPQASGIEITKLMQAHESWNETPVIILSSIGHEVRISEAFGFGASDYITKPFQVGELMARVKARISKPIMH
jgi:DNA-binding response OmpR family regulator